MLMGEFVTAVKYRLPIKVVIVKNNSLGQIRWEQMVCSRKSGVRMRPDAYRSCGICPRLRWFRLHDRGAERMRPYPRSILCDSRSPR